MSQLILGGHLHVCDAPHMTTFSYEPNNLKRAQLKLDSGCVKQIACRSPEKQLTQVIF